METIKKIFKNLICKKEKFETKIEYPDYFKSFFYFLSHPEMERLPGGWRYKGQEYPDYLFVGGASCAIFSIAKKYIKGKGVDIGAGYWKFPGAVAIDLYRGEGKENNLDDFEKDSLDYIFSSHCLEHIKDWKSELKEWKCYLKKGGKIFLYLPHSDCLIWRPGAPGIGNGHKWIPEINKVKDFLLSNKMKIVKYDKGPDAMMSFFICAEK